MDAAKTCSSCGVAKPLDDFHVRSRAHDGRQVWCRPCMSASKRRWRAENPGRNTAAYRAWKYGISPADFDALLASQHGSCAICGTTDPKRGAWHVDHDHATGRVRGVLCHSCNVGLGHFGDNAELLQAAIRYLA